MPHFEITVTEPIHTAVIRDRVPPNDLPRFVPAACGEVWNHVRAAGLPKPGRHIALYLPDGTVEVGVEVGESFPGNARIHCSQLPPGPAAHTTHLGPYTTLANAHTALRTWCAQQGHTLTGVSWELYDHWKPAWNNDPTQIRTDVYQLLRETP